MGEVNAVGYSVHFKPFKADVRQGLQRYLIRLQVQGESVMLIDGELEKVYPGDLLLYKPGDPYYITIGNDTGERSCICADYFLIFSGEGVDEWWQSRSYAQRNFVPAADPLLNIWKQMMYEKRRVKEEDPEVLDYLLRIFLRYIDRVLLENKEIQEKKLFVTHRIKQYIERNATSAIKLQDIAAYASLSVSRTTHLFKEAFGKTIFDYVNEVRIHIACERIRFSSMTLEQAAESAGFNSYSYFYRIFHKKVGISPKQYQDQMGIGIWSR